jgi:imidazolonepropionase
MALLIKDISQLLTCRNESNLPKKGQEQADIGFLKNCNIFIEKDTVSFTGSSKALLTYLKKNKKKDFKEISGKGKVVMPGFIDSHTHFVFAGNREDEYEMRIAGKSYEEIAAAGGGIVNTVGAVRKTPKAKLKELALKRLHNFVQAGVTTLEGKSGYGLDTQNEIKILEVINELNSDNPYGLDILPTFLGAHAVPKGIKKEEYIDALLYEMIPEIKKRELAVFIDAFCEVNYFTAEETIRILTDGLMFGLIPKLHTDQFHSIGGVEAAISCNAISADHLEVLKDEDINKLSVYNRAANSYMIAGLLPGVSYFLDIAYPPARKLIDEGVPVALATDFNPGSCMTENLQLIMSIASSKLKMTAEEIINAVTYNAACSLFIQNKAGSIEEGKQADIGIFDMSSYKELLYHFGVNQLECLVKKGKIVYKK